LGVGVLLPSTADVNPTLSSAVETWGFVSKHKQLLCLQRAALKATAAAFDGRGQAGLRLSGSMENTLSRPLRALSHPTLWTVVLAGIVALPLVHRVMGPPTRPLPVLGWVPAFRFLDQNGAPFGPQALAGKPWLVDFVFTRCPTVCPLMTERLVELEPRLPESVHLVSVSVDPDFDTPARLRAFAEEHGAATPRWHFLTGDSEAIQRAVVDGFKITLAHDGPTDDFLNIVHGVHVVLVDGSGRIRGYYDSSDAEAMERLVADARRLGG
jgi:protein SCO1